MEKDEVLGYENPDLFRNRWVEVFLEGGRINVAIVDSSQNFSEMMGRRKPVGITKIWWNLSSLEGHQFANMGVSALLTIGIAESIYLLCVSHIRGDGDFNDPVSVVKLVSGYFLQELLTNPVKAIEKEIAEEVLLTLFGGWILRFEREGHSLGRPFAEHFTDYPLVIKVIPAKEVKSHKGYQLPGLVSLPIFIEAQKIKDNPRIYFHAPTNSVQLVFPYHLDSPDFTELKAYLDHTETNLIGSLLKHIFHPEGIVLIELENGDLTDRVYNLIHGKLDGLDPQKILLSEAFAPKRKGIVERDNLSLTEYLSLRI